MVINVHKRNVKNVGRYEAFLNGENVTDRTFYADTRRGVVRMYAKADDCDIEGGIVTSVRTRKRERVLTLAVDEVVTIEARGHVRLRRIG